MTFVYSRVAMEMVNFGIAFNDADAANGQGPAWLVCTLCGPCGGCVKYIDLALPGSLKRVLGIYFATKILLLLLPRLPEGMPVFFF